MKVLRAAAILTLLLAGPTYAQRGAPAAPAPASEPPKSPGQIEAEKSADQAYKKSLRNIPDQPPADPWGGARAVDGPGSSSSAQPKRTKASGGSSN
jgi:hypothetical protein